MLPRLEDRTTHELEAGAAAGPGLHSELVNLSHRDFNLRALFAVDVIKGGYDAGLSRSRKSRRAGLGSSQHRPLSLIHI